MYIDAQGEPECIYTVNQNGWILDVLVKFEEVFPKRVEHIVDSPVVVGLQLLKVTRFHRDRRWGGRDGLTRGGNGDTGCVRASRDLGWGEPERR